MEGENNNDIYNGSEQVWSVHWSSPKHEDVEERRVKLSPPAPPATFKKTIKFHSSHSNKMLRQQIDTLEKMIHSLSLTQRNGEEEEIQHATNDGKAVFDSKIDDVDYDSDESTVDSLILTRERFAKNHAVMAGLIRRQKDDVPSSARRRNRRRQHRREPPKMWRDALFYTRPLEPNHDDDVDEKPQIHPRWRQRRNPFRRVVQRDSMSLTRERHPNLVHIYPDNIRSKGRGEYDDDSSTASDSSGIDSLDLARTRRVPSMDKVDADADIDSPKKAAFGTLYCIQKFRTLPSGKVCWDMPEDVNKSEHQQVQKPGLEEGLLQDGPRGGANCAA